MTTQYRAVSVRTGSLMLDNRNARLPEEMRSPNQRALLQALLETEDVKDLARSIAKLGIFPNERLVAMQDGHKYVVLEGNRRLAAIKLLLNPELAPTTALVKTFRRLSEMADLQSLGKLDVAVVKDRVSAAPIIAALHIGQAKKGWSNLQQARYYRELVEQGQSIADVADEIGTTVAEVQSFLRNEQLHRIALSLEYEPEMRRKIEDSRFPLTTLGRFIESRAGRHAMGLELGNDGNLRGTVHPERFKSILNRVARDVATEKGFTRRINDDTGIQGYFKEIEATLPVTPKRGKFDPKVLLGEKPTSKPDEQAKRSKPVARAPRISSSIVPVGYACTSQHERVRAIFGELKSMKIANQKNSTGIMLRVLIDIALWQFIVEKGLSHAICDHFDRDGKKRRYDSTWTPPLRDLISYMCDKQQFPGMDAAGYKAVRLLASKNARDMITIDGFNAYTHNPHVTPTESELRALWQRTRPMLDIILN